MTFSSLAGVASSCKPDQLTTYSQKPALSFKHTFSWCNLDNIACSFSWRRFNYKPEKNDLEKAYMKVMSIFEDTIASFLTPQEKAKLSMTSREMNRLVVPCLMNDLKSRILEIQSLFRGIICFRDLVYSLNFSGRTWINMKKTITEHPLFEDILKTTKDDFKKTIKEYKKIQDEDLLRCCRKYFPKAVIEQVDALQSFDEKMTFARRLLKENRRNNNLVPFDSPEVDLNGLGLKTFPKEFLSYFTLIRSISLPFNDISFFPYDASAFTEVENLVLSNNKFRRIDLSGSFPRLRFLYLDLNQLKDMTLNPRKFPQLEHLRLAFNELEKMPEEILQLPRLQEVDICSNPVCKNLPLKFAKNKKITSFQALELRGILPAIVLAAGPIIFGSLALIYFKQKIKST